MRMSRLLLLLIVLSFSLPSAIAQANPQKLARQAVVSVLGASGAAPITNGGFNPNYFRVTLASVSGQVPHSVLPASPLSASVLYRPGVEYADSAVVGVSGQEFTQAIRLRTLKAPSNPYDIQWNLKTTQPVAKDDVLLASFYLRRIAPINAPGYTTFVFEKASADWNKSANRVVTEEQGVWQRFYVAFQADADYAAGQAQINFQLGFAPQTIEIGGLTVTNWLKTVALTNLPDTFTYVGRSPEAGWRTAAAERIDRYRKADWSIVVQDESGRPAIGARVQARMKRHSFAFGSAVDATRLLDGSADGLTYRAKVRELFNQVVMENDLKWGPWEQNRTRAINGVNWLRNNGIEVRGHNLIWPSWRNSPADLEKLATVDALRARVNAHFNDEAKAMSGKLVDWDVINEPFDNHDIIDILGTSEMAAWFRLARQNDAQARLFLNDYNIIETPGQSTPHQLAFFDFVQMLLDQGAPLEGLGLQSHFSSYLTPPEELVAKLDRLAQYGLDIKATEFDINLKDPEVQADYLRDFMTVMFSHPSVTGVIMWGFWEGQHWLPDAALYRRDWSLKPNGVMWTNLVFKEWWTVAEGTTDQEGRLSVRGFKGAYDLTVIQPDRTNTFSAELATNQILSLVVPDGRELLKNGDFAKGLSDWTTEQFAPAQARFTVANDFNGSPASKTEVLAVSAVGWHAQVYQEKLLLTAGQYYLLSFWAKADRSTPMTVTLMRSYGDYANVGYVGNVNLDGTWRQFHAYFKPTTTDANLRICFNGFCQQAVTVWLADVSLALPEALMITTVALADGRVGEAYDQTLNADGGVGDLTWTLVSGNRPDGLTLRSTGVLAGVPTVPGTNTFRIQAKDVAGNIVTREFAVVIAPGVTVTPEISWPNPADITYGTALGDAQLNAAATDGGTNVPGSFAYTPIRGTVLDAGQGRTLSVTFSPANTGHYAPTNGSAMINVLKAPLTVVADSTQRLAGQANPVFTGVVTGVVNGDPVTVDYTCEATSASSLGSYEILPRLNDPNSRLGNYNATVTKGTLVVNAAPLVITTGSLPAASMGIDYHYQVQAAGGVGPYTWALVSGQPSPGLTFDAGGGLAGNPTSGGTNQFTVQVKDSLNATAIAVLTIEVVIPEGRELLKNGDFAKGLNDWITQQVAPAQARFTVANEFNGSPASKTEVLATSSVGWHAQVYQENLSLTAGQYYLLSYWAKANRTTPMTVTLMRSYGDYATVGYYATVNLDGTWRQFHAYFKPTVTDTDLRICFNGFCSQLVTVWLADVSLALPKALWITTDHLADGRVGEEYNQTLNADGGVGNRTWTLISGSRPEGLTLRSTGVLTGVPAVVGTNSFRIQAKDVAGTMATRDFTVVIAPAAITTPEISWASPADIVYGAALGDAQLNAVASAGGTNVLGSFAYTPIRGMVLDAGQGQTLSVTFTPSNAELFTPAEGRAAINVLKAPLIVVADSAQRVAGQANPVFTGTLSGVVNGDSISAAFISVADEASGAGDYEIIPVLQDPDSRLANYEVTLVKGMLTVYPLVPPSLEISVTDGTATLTIAASTGLQVQIQTADDLSAEWTTRETLTMAAATERWSDRQPTLSSARFYRLQVK